MGKKYNSLMTIAFSVLHDEEDGSDITAHHIRERLTERINCDDQEVCEAVGVGVKEHLKDTFENDKEIVKCGGCEQSAEIGKDSFSKEDWTYSWIDIPLCDDCYTEVRVTIADRFGIKNWGRIDL